VKGCDNATRQKDKRHNLTKMVDADKLVLFDVSNSDDTDIVFIEQFVQSVIGFSSQYGSDVSISYTAYNITGKPSKFPDYGDFPQAFVMVCYMLRMYITRKKSFWYILTGVLLRGFGK
jgi:hypothetical protein